MAGFPSPRALLDHVGEQLGSSDWILVDQARINGFADATGDHQWIHVDVERARLGPYGTTIAHGYLTLSLAPAMLAQVVAVEEVQAAVNYGVNKVRFPAPVPVDSRVRGHLSLASAEPRGESVQVVFGLHVEIDSTDRPACIADVVVLYS